MSYNQGEQRVRVMGGMMSFWVKLRAEVKDRRSLRWNQYKISKT